ncbi:SDR family NAD(P)-dependent oxidoreductase [Herpetosiphon giganteus]|uniref:SDR family NAD(P)-dependent oxidoreductase n=1 Tax=Herpetosiphon giganteus TaxID=2029754 RepID=UPI00195E402E|nr:SDR family NAD(P)-dependent oxidoreductase [Herpetosiphon giganteus]MBM7844728.1 short-subunit dehydrogenase [Herpetosiphon giganteus]
MVVLITGAGTGLGQAMALALGKRGATIILVGRRREKLAHSAGLITQAGGQAWPIVCDLSDQQAVQTLAKQIKHRYLQLDLIIHNAAILAGGAFEQLPEQHILAAITANLVSPIWLTRHLLPKAILIVGSTVSRVAMPGASLYSLSKAALEAWALALAAETTIRVVRAYPPASKTAMTAAMAQQSGHRFPLAEPNQVGEHIIQHYLAGESEIILSINDRLLFWLQRYSPKLLQALLKRYHRQLIKLWSA